MLLLTLLILLLLFIYVMFTKHFQYWSERKIAQESLWDICKGIFRLFFQNVPMTQIYEEHDRVFPNERYLGIYNYYVIPCFMVRDPDLIKQIMVKDFAFFTDHTPVGVTDPLWGKNLILLNGDQWKFMRTKLNPLFTSSKMKLMFDIIWKSSDTFISHFDCKSGNLSTVEVNDIFTRYATDIIACVIFGVSCDSIKDPESDFYINGKRAMDFGGFRFILLMLFSLVPRLSKFLGTQFYPLTVRNFFFKLMKDNIEIRERDNIIRQDLINILMEAKKCNSKNKNLKEDILELTEDVATAQALLFFGAGIKTVATDMALLAYELSLNADIQKKLQNEIDEVLHNSDKSVTYNTLTKMKYLDMVVSETMRKWPSAIQMNRRCVKPYTIEPIRPEENPVYLEEGETVTVSIYGIHRNPRFFPDPDCFDPERFSETNKKNIIPYTYLPFGTGPRICIGYRLSLLEIKIVFFKILSKFDIVQVRETSVPVLERDPIGLSIKNDMWLGLKPRKF